MALRQQGLNISRLAVKAGISRQSLYNMFDQESVFNSTMKKILEVLQVSYEEITVNRRSVVAIMSHAPNRIRQGALKLTQFCKENQATLILFGSRARGLETIRADWDFGLYFHQSNRDQKLRCLKQKLQEECFPYRIDIANLTSAPKWFLQSIKNDYVIINGDPLPSELFGRSAA